MLMFNDGSFDNERVDQLMQKMNLGFSKKSSDNLLPADILMADTGPLNPTYENPLLQSYQPHSKSAFLHDILSVTQERGKKLNTHSSKDLYNSNKGHNDYYPTDKKPYRSYMGESKDEFTSGGWNVDSDTSN